MAYGYWKSGVANRETVFHLFFRQHPFGGGVSIACGLEHVIDFLDRFQFTPDDLAYLATLTGNDQKPLFEEDFLTYLGTLKFDCDVDAIPEGTTVFPHEPLVRVRGNIIPCQILETPLLNIINFQTLIATKAARICLATGGDPVLEFGLRRAQGIDGALAASRAAYIGGCSATSNVLAGKYFDIPVKGTHAHSWVMCFDTEIEAFEQYANAMPNNCVFLVDTYDTLPGVQRAIEVGKRLRATGHELIGIRLDSGDLAFLSIEARRMLDDAGFPDAHIIASNDLDEHIIASLKTQGATIGIWGVGTKLATAYDQPAMGGVYKLSAVRKPDHTWQYKVKLSEQSLKVSNPGIQQIRRFTLDDEFIADMIYDVPTGVTDQREIVDPMDMTRRKIIPPDAKHTDLLVPIMRTGRTVYKRPNIHDIRKHAQQQLSRFHAGVKRFVHPHEYPVGLERSLFDIRTQLILEARGHGR